MKEEDKIDIEHAINLALKYKDQERQEIDEDLRDIFDKFIKRLPKLKEKLYFDTNRKYDILLAALEMIESELLRVKGNINQEDYDDENPFRNTGNVEGYKNDTFEVHAYYWGDEDELIERPNFKWKDVEISWYKHVGRGLSPSRELTPDEISVMLEECLESIRKEDVF